MEARCVPSCKTRGLESFCYDRTCTKYVLCFDGTPVIRQCSIGLQYNGQTDRCDFPQYVDCVDNMCIRENNPNAIVFIASKARCDKYFICNDGLPNVMTCAKGLQYNPSTQSCDFASKVNCTVGVLEVQSSKVPWELLKEWFLYFRSRPCRGIFCPLPELLLVVLTSSVLRRAPILLPTRSARMPTITA